MSSGLLISIALVSLPPLIRGGLGKHPHPASPLPGGGENSLINGMMLLILPSVGELNP